MATYTRPTSPDVFDPILFNAPIDQLAQAQRQKQLLYNGNVNALAAQRNDFLQLEKNAFYDFNKPRIAEFNRKANQELEKVAYADYSLNDNVVASRNVYKPLITDPYIIKDQEMRAKEMNGEQSFSQWRAIDDKAAMEGKNSSLYSNENYLYWKRRVNTAKKAAPNQLDLFDVAKPTPYVDVSGKLLKMAKDNKLEVVTIGSSPDNRFIVTYTNGQAARVPIGQYFSNALNANDMEQLEINADNRMYNAAQLHIAEQKAIGVELSEEAAVKELGQQWYDKSVPTLTVNRNIHDNEYAKVKKEIDKYDPKAVHTDAEAIKYMQNVQLLDYHSGQRDIYQDYLDSPAKDIAGIKLFKDNYKSTFVDNIATSYANATAKEAVEVNQFELLRIKSLYDEQLERVKAGLEKEKEKKPSFGDVPLYDDAKIPTNEVPNSYKFLVDMEAGLSKELFNLNDRFFDIHYGNSTGTYEKISSLPKTNEKGEKIFVNQTGLPKAEVDAIIKQMIDSGMTGVAGLYQGTMGELQTAVTKFQEQEMNKLIRDPSAAANLDAEKQKFIARASTLQSHLKSIADVRKKAVAENITGKSGFTKEFVNMVSGFDQDPQFAISDFISAEGVLMTEAEFLERANTATQVAPRFAPLAGVGERRGIKNPQGVKLSYPSEEALKKIYKDNIGAAAKKLDEWTGKYLDKEGWKAAGFSIINVTKDDGDRADRVFKQVSSQFASDIDSHWAGQFNTGKRLEEVSGLFTNVQQNNIASVDYHEFGSGQNFVTVKYTEDYIKSLRDPKGIGANIPKDLVNEIANYGLRLKNVRYEGSDMNRQKSLIDLSLQKGHKVNMDLSYSADFPFKASVGFKKSVLNPGSGDYVVSIESIRPEVNPDGTLVTDAEGRVKFRKPVAGETEDISIPVDVEGGTSTVNYILPSLENVIADRRLFYAFANSGEYKKINPNIKTMAQLMSAFIEYYRNKGGYQVQPAYVFPSNQQVGPKPQ